MLYLRKFFLVPSVFVLFFLFTALQVSADGSRLGLLTGDSVNLREEPTTSSESLAKLSENTPVVVIDSSDEWFKVIYQDKEGWINGDYLSVEDAPTASLVGSNVNVRTGPSTNDSIIMSLSKGEAVNIFGRSGQWYRVQLSDGTLGWIFGKYVSFRDSGSSRGESDIPNIDGFTAESGSGSKVIEYAKRFLGVKYRYGGMSPTSGFDCSGYIKYVYNNFGINLQRVAASQAKQGSKVSKSELRAGDLVFFDTDGGHNYINHSGIYIGDGSFIHASSGRSSYRVTISNLNEGFYANSYMSARRVMN